MNEVAMDPEDEFVMALLEHQRTNHFTDAEFSNRLGVSLSLWRHTRAKRLPLGWKLLAASSSLVTYDLVMAAQASLIKRARRPRQKRLKGNAA